jgi:hypothetical protein
MIHKIKIIVFLLVVMSSCSTVVENLEVKIVDKQLIVEESPYFIKGICYHPVPKGSDQRSFNNLTNDLALMVDAGINTIRVYSPIDNKAVLDEIHKAGIKVIIGFGYNQNGNFDILSGSFADYIDKYKNHEAILFWELGNEYNYHPEWFENDISNWYTSLNNAADVIHGLDKNHPVATAHGELPDSLAIDKSPNIDIWGINVYRWDNPESLFSEWDAISSKPIYLSEAGADSYMTISKNNFEQGENQDAQAAATKNILEAIFKSKNRSLGVTLFSFTDGWWKAGDNATQDPGGWAPNSSGVPYDGSPNEEYWGIVDIDRNKKKAYSIVQQVYKETNTN